MSENPEEERQLLLQSERLHYIKSELTKGPWVTVYRYQEAVHDFFDFFCALVPREFADRAMAKPEWDLSIGEGTPGFITSYSQDGIGPTRYLRFGNDEGIEPLILLRHFHSGRSNRIEISQEFELLYNLVEQPSEGTFLWCDRDGNEEVAVEVDAGEKQSLRIKQQFLLDYLATKTMDLLIFFEGRRFSHIQLAGLDLRTDTIEVREPTLTYNLGIADYRDPVIGSKSMSRLLGKVLVRCPEKRLSKFTGSRKEPYCDFIVGLDSNGDVTNCDVILANI
jgi:hypothetical protein